MDSNFNDFSRVSIFHAKLNMIASSLFAVILLVFGIMLIVKSEKRISTIATVTSVSYCDKVSKICHVEVSYYTKDSNTQIKTMISVPYHEAADKLVENDEIEVFYLKTKVENITYRYMSFTKVGIFLIMFSLLMVLSIFIHKYYMDQLNNAWTYDFIFH